MLQRHMDTETMSNEKYLGAIEFINAIASIRKKLEQAPTFEAAIPCHADASYTNEESLAVPASVTVDTYQSKNRPGPSYFLQLKAKLNDYGFKEFLVAGTKEELTQWLDEYNNYDKVAALLFSSYRGAWESLDSVRYRDY